MQQLGKVLEKLWDIYDEDANGDLDIEETDKLLKVSAINYSNRSALWASPPSLDRDIDLHTFPDLHANEDRNDEAEPFPWNDDFSPSADSRGR